MHNDILTAEQLALVPLIKQFAPQFYLVGGTALALQYGHRRSIDFDLFSRTKFDNNHLKAILKKEYPIQKTFLQSEGEMTLLINGVKLTFFNFEYDIPVVVNWDEVMNLPDPLTIGAMKAFALGMRSKWKDYVDLYFILHHHSIQEIIAQAEKIFGIGEFNSKLFREQLAYHKDISYVEPIEYMTGQGVEQSVILEYLIEASIA